MRHVSIIVTVLIVLCGSSWSAAQVLMGDRLVPNASAGPATQAAVGIYVAGTGAFRAALFPAMRTRAVMDITMDAGNTNMLARLRETQLGVHVLARVTPAGVVSTLATIPNSAQDGGTALDEDGSYLTTGTGLSMVRVTNAGVTTIATPHRPDHILVNPFTGDYWIGSFGGQLAVMDRHTLSVTSLSVGRFASFFGVAFDTRTDSVVLASQIDPGLFFVDQLGQVLTTIDFPGTTFGVSIDPANGHWHVIQNFDLLEATALGTVLRTTPLTGVPNPSGVEVYGSRPLSGAGVARPGGTYSLFVGFPGHAGRSYAILLSLSGLRPGVRLGGGGFVGLAPDPLFFHTATVGDIPGVTQGLRGVLSPLANATATIRFPPRMPTGLRVHASVVLVDPSLPGGLQSSNTWGFDVHP